MKHFWQKPAFIRGVYICLALLVSFQKWFLTHQKGGTGATDYENYLIFRNAFRHLCNHQNLYQAFPSEQWDLFKYSPAFALFMAPFDPLPDFWGLSLWNLINALVPLFALYQITPLLPRQKAFIAWFVLPEMVISLQNSQSNGLTLGCLLWAFSSFERTKWFSAAWGIAAATFIKIFGIITAPAALLYPSQSTFWWKLAFSGLFFFFLPLILVSPQQLIQLYVWWWHLLQNDHSASVGLSIAGWLSAWFGWSPPKILITLSGLGVLLATIWMHQQKAGWSERLAIWGTLLVWVVIFNHKAESPTFVIALCGAALWYCSLEKANYFETTLLILVFIFASLTPTDLFPTRIRTQWVQPYALKAVPCIVLWVYASAKLLLLPPKRQLEPMNT